MNINYFALSLLISGVTVAEETILVLDTFEVMRKSAPGEELAKNIEAKHAKIAADIEADSKKYEVAAKEVQSKLSTMSKAARDKEELRLAKMQRDLKAKAEDGEATLKTMMEQATGDLAGKVEVAVNEYAKTAKPAIILDQSTGRVIYADGRVNISDDIKKEMNKKYAAAQPKVGGASISKVNTAAPVA